MIWIFNIFCQNAPIAVPSNNSPYCEGDEIQLIGAANFSGTITDWLWTGPNGFTSAEQNPIVSEAGTYILTVSADTCVSAPDSTEVIVFSKLATPLLGCGFSGFNSITFECADIANAMYYEVSYSVNGNP
ncbi:MAG: PKD domain-containing protein [Sphingobacteriales bacterium]|nr:PKD domain-containing protein [Sphingobacteriales bacterium]